MDELDGNEAEPEEFQAWFDTITRDAKVDRAHAEGVRRWLLDLYRSQGPVTYDLVELAWLLDQIALAEEAVLAVVDDLHRTSRERPRIRVDDHEKRVRITVGGAYTTPSMDALPFERSAAFAEVASYIQEKVMGNYGPVWPTCHEHGYGLHAQVHDDRAEWWCLPSPHRVAEVGNLGT
jgi:hypothetical protein